MKKNALWLLFAILVLLSCRPSKQERPVDKEALVSRRSPRLTSFDVLSPLSVGNGSFEFTVDATGMQTFPESYRAFAPLRTRCASLPATMQPDRLHIGLNFGDNVGPEQISNVQQWLDMWDGVIDSRFMYAGSEFAVQTTCDPKQNLVGFHIDSRMFTGVDFRFERDSLSTVRLLRLTPPTALFQCVRYMDVDSTAAIHAAHVDTTHADTLHLAHSASSPTLARRDSTVYYLSVRWEGDAGLREETPGYFILKPRVPTFAVVCLFTPDEPPLQQRLPDYSTVAVASSEYWQSFWQKETLYDLLFSTDPRAPELERRIVCTQYAAALRQHLDSIPLPLSDYCRDAIAAARRGDADQAVDLLLTDPHTNACLPDNNGLLQAIDLMCNGWEGSKEPFPGFPKDGKWVIRK